MILIYTNLFEYLHENTTYFNYIHFYYCFYFINGKDFTSYTKNVLSDSSERFEAGLF